MKQTKATKANAQQLYDVIVIGGGAAGITASIRSAERGRRTLLIEKGEKIGRKILASGNGRCNMMNIGSYRYYGDPMFAQETLNTTPVSEMISFFKHYGLFMTEEEDGRVYPVTYQSSSTLSVLKTAMLSAGVTVKTMKCAETVQKSGDQFDLVTTDGECVLCRKLIIACGGAAQPKLGGSIDGYRILTSFGHRMINASPALVPLKTDEKSRSGLSGLRVRCSVTVLNDEIPVHREKGEVLFTEYGISGICVMQCARFINNSGTKISLNLLESVFPDKQSAFDEVQRRRKLFSEFSPVHLLNGILPDKLSYAVMKQAGLPLRGETVGMLSDNQAELIVQKAYDYRLNINGTRGMSYAQVTAGGIDCKEFNPRTMESKLVSGLYAAGEVLNVDGDCGGFNLMFAFSSGINAGNAV